jgi:hypothetical protein
VRRCTVAHAIAAIGICVLGGCSWFLPHPDRASNVIGDADTPLDGRCSLAVVQNRKSLFGQIIADGVPKPLLIRIQSSDAPNREIQNGQTIFFVESTRDADPPRNFGPAMSRLQTKAQPMTRPALWRLEAVNASGNAITENAVLMDRGVVELREIEGSGYLELQARSASIAVPRTEASRFVLYKADVPDPTRPTTCDGQIRDEDFVFVRTLAPSSWVSVAATGMLEVQSVPAGATPVAVGSSRNPECAREEERCHTDSRGGLVCVWAPVCGE